MMNVGLALVDPLAFRHRVPEPPREDDALALNLFLKGELCAGKQTYGQLSSSTDAKPRVIVSGNLVVTSLSPTLAGRDATRCRL